MADGSSYRGLEIKIGADTTQLRKELKNVESAASQAQRELRKIGKDLKLDPQAVTALKLQLQLTGDRAESLSAKLATMRKSLKSIPTDALKKLSDSTYNVTLETQRALRGYETLNAKIEQVKREARDLSKAAGVDFTKDMHANELIANLEKENKLTAEQAAHVADLRTRYDALAGAQQKASAALDRANDVSKARGLTEEISHTVTEVRALAEQYSRLAAQREVGKGLKPLREDAKACREQMDGLAREIQNIDQALEGAGFHDSLKLISTRSQSLKDQAQMEQRLMSDLSRQMDVLRSRWDGLDAMPSGGLSNALIDARDAATKATAALKEQEGRVESLRAEWERLDAQQRNGQGVASQLDRVESEIRQATSRMNELRAAAREAQSALNFREAQAELRSLSTAEEQAASRFRSLQAAASSATGGMAGKVRSLGVSLTASVTPAVMMATQSIISSADQIDSAYRSMKKTTSGTEEDFQRILKDAVEMSKTQAVSADEILNIEALGGQMGIAAENVEKFAQVVSNLDIATNVNSEDMSLILGQMSNILGLTSDEYQSFGDSIVRLGNNLPTQESNIAAITKRIGAMGTMVGMTGDQILGWAGAIAATGQNQEAAGTAISTTMTQLENAVASGGESLKGFAKVSGMSEEEFSQAWKTDASGAMEAFIKGLANIKASGGSVSQTLTDLGINGVRQRQALNGLTMEVDNLDNSLRMSKDAWNGVDDEFGQAGDAAREAQQKSEGFSGALKILKNDIQDLGFAFADALTPMLTSIGTGLQTVEGAVSKLSPEVQRAIVTVGMLATGLGPALNAGGALVNFIESARGEAARFFTWLKYGTGPLAAFNAGLASSGKTLSKLPGALSKVGTALSTVITVMKGVPGIAKAAGAALAVIVAGLVSNAMKMHDTTEEINELSGGLKSFTDEAANAQKVQDGLSRISASTDDLVAKANDSFGKTKDMIKEWADDISNAEVKSDLIDGYRDKINELAGTIDGDKAKLAELQSAIRLYNSATGDSITITDQYTGAISKSTDELNKNTDAYINNIKHQAYTENIKQAYQEIANHEVTLKQLQDEAQKYVDNGLLNGDYTSNVIDGFGSKFGAIKIGGEGQHFFGKSEIDDANRLSQAIAQTNSDISAFNNSITTAESLDKDLAASSQASADAATTQAKAYDDAAGAQQALYEMMLGTTDATQTQTVSTKDAAESIDGYLQQAKDLIAQNGDAAESSDEFTNAATGIGQTLQAAGIDMSNFGEDMLQAAVDGGYTGEQLVELAAKVAKMREEAAKNAETISEMREESSFFDERVGTWGTSLEDFASNLNNVGMSLSDVKSEYESLSNLDVKMPWEDKQQDLSAGDLLQNIQDQINGVSQWSDNIMALYDEASQYIDDDVNGSMARAAEWLQSLGPEYSGLIQEVVTDAQNGGNELWRIGEALRIANEANANSAIDNAEAKYEYMKEYAEKTGQSIEDAGEQVYGYTAEQTDQVVQQAQAGADGVQGAAEGAAEGTADAAQQGAAAVSDAATDATNAAVDKWTQAGIEAGDLITGSMDQWVDQMRERGRLGATNLVDGFQDVDMGGSGEKIVSGLIDDINSQLSSVDSGKIDASHIKSAIESAISQATNVASGAEADQAAASSGGSAASGIGSGIVQSMVSSINQSLQAIQSSSFDLSPISNALSATELGDNAFPGYGTKVADAIQASIDTAVRGKTFNMSAVETAVSNALQGASGPAGGAAADSGSGSGVGEEVAKGIVSSINDALGGISSANITNAGSVASAVVNAIKANAGVGGYEDAGNAIRDAIIDKVNNADWSGTKIDLGNAFDSVGDGAGQKIIDAIKASLQAGSGDLTSSGSVAATAILQGVISERDMAGEAGRLLGSGVAQGFENNVYYEGPGASVGQKIAQGVVSTTGTSEEAGRLLGSNVIYGISGLDYYTPGVTTGYDFASGVVSQVGTANEAGRLLGANAIDSMDAYAGEAYTYGSHYGSNFAAGISSQIGAVSAASSALAAAAAAPLHHTTPKVGPLKGDDKWGYEMGANIASGMVESTRLVAAASTGMAQAMAKSRAALTSPKSAINVTLDDGAQQVTDAVNRLNKKISSDEFGARVTNVNGISVNRGSDIANAIGMLADALKVEGRV